MNAAQYILISGARLYRWVISPAKTALFGPLAHCRFTPSCSEYAIQAVRLHGTLAGTCLALKRIGRCHPWGGCGWDPVPSLPPARACSPPPGPGSGLNSCLPPQARRARQLGTPPSTGAAAAPAKRSRPGSHPPAGRLGHFHQMS